MRNILESIIFLELKITESVYGGMGLTRSGPKGWIFNCFRSQATVVAKEQQNSVCHFLINSLTEGQNCTFCKQLGVVDPLQVDQDADMRTNMNQGTGNEN